MSALLDSLSAGFSGDAARRAVLDEALRDGLPGPRTEAWKYTSLRQLERRSFTAVEALPSLDPKLLADIPAPRAVLVNGRYSDSEYNASFVGFIPSRRPVYTILVVIDTPRAGSYYGGPVAGPIFKRIAEAALQYAGVPPTVNPAPLTIAELTVTGAVPVDVSVNDCVAPVFTVTLPKREDASATPAGTPYTPAEDAPMWNTWTASPKSITTASSGARSPPAGDATMKSSSCASAHLGSSRPSSS